MEPLRDNQYILQGGGVRWSLVFSLLLLVFGLGLLFAVLFVNKRKEGVIFGSKKGEPYGITRYIKDYKEEVAYKNNVNIMCKIYPENYEEPPVKEESEKGLFEKVLGLFKKKDREETSMEKDQAETLETEQTQDASENKENEE